MRSPARDVDAVLVDLVRRDLLRVDDARRVRRDRRARARAEQRGNEHRGERCGELIAAPARHAAPLLAPVLGQHRVAHVVAPAAGDLHVAPRKAFARETEPRDQCERAHIGRLHVDLDAMQLQDAERGVEHQREPFGHVAPAGGGAKA